MLVDAPGRATVVIVDQSGGVKATSHTYFAHNEFSPRRQTAWAGLVAVDPSMRGTGLGRYVNARSVQLAITELGAVSVYELVSPTNAASRRMFEASVPKYPAISCFLIPQCIGPQYRAD